MLHELQRAERVGDALQIVALSVGEVVHRVGVPFVARANVGNVHDAIEQRVAEEHVGVSHVYLSSQHEGAGDGLAAIHEAEQAQAFLCRTVAEGAVGAGLRGSALLLGYHLGALLIDVSPTLHDEPFGKVPKLLEVVAGIEDVVPLEAEPLDVVLDALYVLGVLLRGVRVVETEVACAAILLGNAEVQRNGLGMTDVQVAVRLGREARLDASAVKTFRQVLLHFLLYEVEALLFLDVTVDCLCHVD